jgi:hypothetical protein
MQMVPHVHKFLIEEILRDKGRWLKRKGRFKAIALPD